MNRVTVAPITSTVKGLTTEVPLGPENGLDHPCIASCDNIITIDKAALGHHIGFLFDRQEAELSKAIISAFALSVDSAG
ncbi:type II toxin-antitoxin system PemK/MazF family toxin [Citricoccus parietis]